MKLFSSKGPVVLDESKVLGRGGEGKVYAVAREASLAAKIYESPTRQREEKVLHMLRQAPTDPGASQGHVSIAWPLDVLRDSNGIFQGFLMPAIQQSIKFTVVYHPGSRRQHLPAAFGYEYLLRTARNLCAAVGAIHDIGHIVGDLNDDNILVGADARVTLIDCDSFQVGPHKCVVGRPDYTAPEIQGQTYADVNRAKEQDLFALSVLIHQLLMNGTHPYAGVGEPGDLAQRIERGICPYQPGGPKPPLMAPRVEWLSKQVQALMSQTFVAGHSSPSQRPGSKAWMAALSQSEQDLLTCKRDNSHIFFHPHQSCPVCERNKSRQRTKKRTRPTSQRPTGQFQQQPLKPVRAPGAIKPRGRTALYLIVITSFLVAYFWGEIINVDSNLLRHVQPLKSAVSEPSEEDVRRARWDAAQNSPSGTELYKDIMGKPPRKAESIETPVPRGRNDTSRVTQQRGRTPDRTGTELYIEYMGRAPRKTAAPTASNAVQ